MDAGLSMFIPPSPVFYTSWVARLDHQKYGSWKSADPSAHQKCGWVKHFYLDLSGVTFVNSLLSTSIGTHLGSLGLENLGSLTKYQGRKVGTMGWWWWWWGWWWWWWWWWCHSPPTKTTSFTPEEVFFLKATKKELSFLAFPICGQHQRSEDWTPSFRTWEGSFCRSSRIPGSQSSKRQVQAQGPVRRACHEQRFPFLTRKSQKRIHQIASIDWKFFQQTYPPERYSQVVVSCPSRLK